MFALVIVTLTPGSIVLRGAWQGLNSLGQQPSFWQELANGLAFSMTSGAVACLLATALIRRFESHSVAAVSGVSPVADRYVPLGPATRAAWTQPELVAANADLIAWRDRLYERHRPPSAALPSRSGASTPAAPH